MANYPTLEPLWMERHDYLWDMLEEMGLGNLRLKSALEKEAEAYMAGIRSGLYRWPPKILFDENGQPLRRVPRFLRRKVPFMLTNFSCWMTLPSVQRLVTTSNAIAAASGMPDRQRADFVGREVQQLYARWMWDNHGKKVIVVDPDTFDLLANTDIPNFPCGVLRPPFQSFYLKFPPGTFEFDVEGDPVPQPAEGVLVAFDTVEEGADKELSMVVTGKSLRGIPTDDNTLNIDFDMPADARMSDFVLPKPDDKNFNVKGAELARLALTAVVSVCLYLQSEHPDIVPVPPAPRRDLSQIKNKGKRRKAEQQNSRVSQLGYLYVGRPFSSEERDLAEAVRGGRKLDKEVWVKGHYKGQRYGPGNSLLKVIWIAPYRKGPDMAESVSRRLKLQKAQKL